MSKLLYIGPTILLLALGFLGGICIGSIFVESGIWIIVFCMLVVAMIPWYTRWMILGLFVVLCVGYFLSVTTIYSLQNRTRVLGEMTAWGNQTLPISGTITSMIRTSDWARTYSAELTSIEEIMSCSITKVESSKFKTQSSKKVQSSNEKNLTPPEAGGNFEIVSELPLGEGGTNERRGLGGVENVKNNSKQHCLQSVKIALIVPPNLSYETGDSFTALGKFRYPADTPEFASQKNLWYQGIVAEFQVFSTKKYAPEVRAPLVRLRQALNEKLQMLFPERGYELLAGIIIGERSALNSARKQELKSSGLMHIMVVSGSNVMMLIIVLSLIFRGFTPWLRVSIIGASIGGFALLVGGDAPVWRAALMGVVGYGFSLWGYRSWGIILPFVVASVLALVRPLSLVYDIGFQLSFLSVISIIVFSPLFRKWFAFLGGLFDEAAALTLSATLGTLPITLYYFGGFPLIGIIANLLVEPFIPLAMYSGIITLLVSFIAPSFATLLGYIPWILSSYILAIVHFFGSNFPLITFDVQNYRVQWLVLMMAGFALFIVKYGKIGFGSLLIKDKR